MFQIFGNLDLSIHFFFIFSKSAIVRIDLWERYHGLLVAHGSQLGLEWALSRLELISQLAKAADREQSFFLIPPPLHPLCSVRNWERSQVFATRPFLPGLAESVAKSSAVLDGSGNYRARTCRISNIVKCFITASKCFMLRKKCKQWPAITLSLQSSQDHFANMETFNDHISQWSNRELRTRNVMIQTMYHSNVTSLEHIEHVIKTTPILSD